MFGFSWPETIAWILWWVGSGYIFSALGARSERKRYEHEFTWTCPRDDCYFKVGSNMQEITLRFADDHEANHEA